MASKWEEGLKKYDALIALSDQFERKGKTMPYTSANGYMFTLYNKACEIGIRLSKESCKAFMERHNSGIYKSYGAVMKDYVLVPNDLLENKALMAKYLKESFDYVMSLPPK